MEPLRVTYRTALNGDLRAFMTTQLVKYLLFIRGQIPCLYGELLQFVGNYQLQQQPPAGLLRRRRLPINGGIKKAVKCVEAAELLFNEQLDTVFSLRVKRVALIFGASVMSPREAVIVDFDESETKTVNSPLTDPEDMSLEDSITRHSSPPVTREKLMRLCAQKLMRAVFTHAVEQFSSALSATKLHVAVRAERHPARIPGFVPKQQFKLRLPKNKCGVRTHHIVISDDVDGKQLSKCSQQNPEQAPSNNLKSGAPPQSKTVLNDPELMWYVLEKPIPGFSEVINTLNGP